ncbi:MAG: phenylacetate-CoA oxygenase subunit PaaC [Pseudomonadota bacterium]|nr:phenylacetate-CoA oxygenase subunit PaaC [Pseudomonadota bacterium]
MTLRFEPTPRVLFLIRRADDALVLGHRLSEWSSRAPMLEEDLALANLALDQIGLARALYQETGEATGHTEDQLAYLRIEPQYRNCLLVEQPNGDFAQTIVRQLLYSAALDPFWRAASGSTDPAVAGIAAKAEKESAYHLRHAAEWTVRLGDGTAESHERAEAALDAFWPFTGELFEADAAEAELIAAGAAPAPAALRQEWDATMSEVLTRATLARPKDGWMQTGGRTGRHSEHLGPLLAELQHLQRTYPGVEW